MSRGDQVELLLAGFWLGHVQVALGFHLLVSQGAGVGFYFAMLALWLAGALLGTLAPVGRGRGLVLQAVAAGGFVPAIVTARHFPFSLWSLGGVLGAVLLSGAFGGWFLQDRAAAAGREAAGVLFHENNGFVLGYGCAGMLLLVSVPLLDLFTLFLAALTLGWRAWSRTGR
ncbi:MAG: hypothetical protein GX442_07595 [Candidatus Riflebacteria bacterium]|nr:hypothetical protein [Candidatus Riflebacteria bacterium]